MWCKTNSAKMLKFSFWIHPQPPLLHFAFNERLICFLSFSNLRVMQFGESEKILARERERKTENYSTNMRKLCRDLGPEFSSSRAKTFWLQPMADGSSTTPKAASSCKFSFEHRLTSERFLSPTHTPTRSRYFSHCHMKNSPRESGARWDLQVLDKKYFFSVVAFKQKHWELYRSIQFL